MSFKRSYSQPPQIYLNFKFKINYLKYLTRFLQFYLIYRVIDLLARIAWLQPDSGKISELTYYRHFKL